MKYKNMLPWQRKTLCFWSFFIFAVALVFLTVAGSYLALDKKSEQTSWEYYLTEADTFTEEELSVSQNATQVSVGTHVERMDNVDFKNSMFTITFRCWFNWHGNEYKDMEENFSIYRGTIRHITKKAEHWENGDHYQLFEVTADISKDFSTKRFPLGSYQLRLYLQPLENIENIVFIPDYEKSSINPELCTAGFELCRSDHALYLHRQDADTDGAYYKGAGTETYSEFLTAIELRRDSIGLYIKCIIALIGTGLWALIVLFLCAHHQVDSLGMMPAILIGTVTNLMIGANLVPDALHIGLLEFINIWGIYTVLLSAVLVISINRIRSRYKSDAFAEYFGKIMFAMVLITTLAGHIVLPLAAYQF